MPSPKNRSSHNKIDGGPKPVVQGCPETSQRPIFQECGTIVQHIDDKNNSPRELEELRKEMERQVREKKDIVELRQQLARVRLI